MTPDQKTKLLVQHSPSLQNKIIYDMNFNALNDYTIYVEHPSPLKSDHIVFQIEIAHTNA